VPSLSLRCRVRSRCGVGRGPLCCALQSKTTYRYERYGDIHLTILDADSGVLFHDRTSFGTFGGTDSDAFLNERLRPKYYQLNGAYRYVFSLVTKRSLSSDSVVVGAGDMLSGEDDE
jgi:hypothetical protein